MKNEHNLYRDYAGHLRERYGGKVYKLPVNLPGTCPNRDGTLGYGGCIFCDEEGAGFECLDSSLPVKEQLVRNKDFFVRRFNARSFIAYFQAFTNTYLPLPDFKRNITEACELEDLVGISISTRPDCISTEQLQFLQDVREKQKKAGRPLDFTIELGLQTVNYHTLQKINRGHTLAEFLDAAIQVKKAGLDLCVHLILNLPWDDRTDVIENAKILSALRIDYVKLHSLYIVTDTVMGEMYRRGELSLITLDEYIDRVILFLEYLAPQVVIQRLVGKGPQGNLLFCNWGTSWWKIKSLIEEKMARQGSFQGKNFNYLNGKALQTRTESRQKSSGK